MRERPADSNQSLIGTMPTAFCAALPQFAELCQLFSIIRCPFSGTDQDGSSTEPFKWATIFAEQKDVHRIQKKPRNVRLQIQGNIGSFLIYNCQHNDERIFTITVGADHPVNITTIVGENGERLFGPYAEQIAPG